MSKTVALVVLIGAIASIAGGIPEPASAQGSVSAPKPQAGPDPNLRPQTPKPPFPYRVQEVSWDAAGGARIAGTLTLPQGAGPFPAVVLLNGSGPNDRDETIRGHKPFLIIADALTRAGVAVLRYDKRAVGASTGDPQGVTTATYAADAKVAVAWLRRRPEIAPMRVGLLGHSEGAEIATMVAASDPTIAFAVLLAAPALPGDELLLSQSRAILRAQGAAPEKVADAVAANRDIYAIAKSDAPKAELEARVEARLTQAGVPAASVPATAAPVLLPWVRWFLGFDPRPDLSRIRCPVLALDGSKDLQVVAAENLPQLRAALSHDPHATVTELAGLNHLFQTAGTGLPTEYGVIQESFSPGALKLIVDWVVDNDGPAGVKS
jgi:pimeloyl-ACP methyl ester carboxylesterase